MTCSSTQRDSRQLDCIFRPRSIAVIGATAKEFTIGRAIMRNLITNEFRGKLFPVNPKADQIDGLKCYPAVGDIPEPVDMAVVMVKKELVAETIEQCGQKGVRGVVVITSGFKEIGPTGAAEEERVLEIARRWGMRMVGPNCFGVINTDPEISLNATFSKTRPRPGKVAFVSQSGALGEAILDYAYQIKLGFSIFASIGNKADISGNDLLEYLEDDPRTEIILLYLENFKNPRRFAEIARRVGQKKPILAVKAGRTQAGARAISSHTGVLATPEAAVKALFEQAGVVRIDTIDELFDCTLALVNQPLPRGNRVGIITNAGGPGIMAADAAMLAGLDVPHLTDQTVAFLRERLPDMAALGNPVDVIASGGPDAYAAAIQAMFDDPNIDSILCIFVPPIVVDHPAVIKAIAEVVDRYGRTKTVVACFMNVPEAVAGSDELVKRNIPIYTFPEAAARAIAGLSRCATYRSRQYGNVPTFDDIDKKAAEEIISHAIQKGRKTIIGHDAIRLLAAYRIPAVETASVRDIAELEQASLRIGYPQVLKLDDQAAVHKTEVGGVILDVMDNRQAREAFTRLQRLAASSEATVMVQPMITGGVETIIGANRDPAFGPLIIFGLGGILVELLHDVSFRLHPVTDNDARMMIREVKGYKLLTGFRGRAAVDLSMLEEVILRLSQMAGDFPQLESIDINPFFAAPDRANSVAVDARFVLQ